MKISFKNVQQVTSTDFSLRWMIQHEAMNNATPYHSYNRTDSNVRPFVITKKYISSRCSLAVVFHLHNHKSCKWMCISHNGAEGMVNQYTELSAKAHRDSANTVGTSSKPECCWPTVTSKTHTIISDLWGATFSSWTLTSVFHQLLHSVTTSSVIKI